MVQSVSEWQQHCTDDRTWHTEDRERGGVVSWGEGAAGVLVGVWMFAVLGVLDS